MTGRPIDELAGVSASDRARDRFGNGLTGSDVARLTVKDAKPNTGETVWDFLDRHARRLGLLMWMSPDGKLIVASPDYGCEPLYRFIRRYRHDPSDPNTIQGGGLQESAKNSYSTIVVLGRAPGGDAARARVRMTVVNPDWVSPYSRIRYVYSQRVRDLDAAEREGLRAIAMGNQDAFVLTYSMDGHGWGDHLYAQDTVGYVDDEVSGARGAFYIVGRTFHGDRNGGSNTEVKLIPRGAIAV